MLFHGHFLVMKVFRIGFSAGRSTYKNEAIVGRFSSSKGTVVQRG